jgi:hypothetical protein
MGRSSGKSEVVRPRTPEQTDGAAQIPCKFGARVPDFDVSNMFFQVRLHMTKVGWFSRLSNQRTSTAWMQRIAGGIGVAVLLMMAGIAAAQIPTPSEPMSVPAGYTSHQTVDVGGHIADIKGSGAMYDTLVNQQSGPRLMGGTFELRALPTNKHTQIDLLHAIANGFGGDPYNFAKLDFSKGKIYEFSGIFRRDRQYSDYDLLGNPNIPGGQSIPISPTGSLAWPQVNQSPFMYNTVRRMTDTNLTLYPFSKVTFRAGYSQNIFQGPSLSPSGYQFASSYDVLLSEYQRNSTDDFTGGIDWKPVQGTKLTFEEEIDHYKANSYFTMDPSYFTVQEADGTKVALLANYDSLTPSTISACNANSIGTTPMLSAPITPGGLPVVNPACAVITNYLRTQPTRIIYPTETFRLQSTSIKNIAMNGDFRYTNGNMSLSNYEDSFQGLGKASATAGALRTQIYTATGSAKREAAVANYGIVWQATKTFSLADQVSFSNVHQPGTTTMTSLTTALTPLTAGNETINYPTLTTTLVNTATKPATGTFEGSGSIAIPLPGYFGQKFLINNLTGSWEASSRATLSLTYRHGTQTIVQGAASGASSTVISINQDGGIFNAALRPANHWDLNGTAEILYFDNAFTPVGPRQSKHYRVHTTYKPRPWATFSGAFNDLERHNNTNNNQATVALFVPPTLTTASTGTPYISQLQHVDHSRVVSFGAVLAPNEHYGLDINYAYSDVYASTNICYLNGATATLPGAVESATSTVCPNIWGRGATGATEVSGAALSDWIARDFMDAPTQFVSAALHYSPVDRIHSNIGYRISDVNGTRFFNDARDVNGSLVSNYQTPFVNVFWTIHRGLIWKGEYNYFGYNEGGPSGSQYCSTSTSLTAVPVLCSSFAPTYPTGVTEPTSGLTAPRTFRANNVTFSMHYAF